MKPCLPILALGVFALLHSWSANARAEVRPSGIIGDGMVLQRDMETPLWGAAEDGEKVTVHFRGQEVSAVAQQGRWLVRVKSGSAGGPFSLTIAGKNRIEVKDVSVGEVWLCSGQSNMWWPFSPRPGSKELQGTENPGLHLFNVTSALKDTPQTEVPGGQWQVCDPESLGKFSAVAYYFGRSLQSALHMPIGLIHASYGGSMASLWINPAAFATDHALQELRLPNPVPRLYNGVIAPLVPYGIRGVIWYQGEADAPRAIQYRALFEGLIRGWRKEWGQGDFPFLFVQLAPYGKIVHEPQESSWAVVRETQRQISLKVPATGMAVITDYGHEVQIHPQPKQPVGERLALLARGVVYGDHEVAYSGPTFASMKVEGEKAILEFQHAGSGLESREMVLENVSKDGRSGESGGALHVRQGNAGAAVPLQGFTIAGADGRFVNASAEIRGSHVEVRSSEVPKPTAVRYGWANYPTGNLFNKEGLPASPFRTDDFVLK